MVNSRDLNLLRSDVRQNVEKFLAECKAQGLKVLVTQTVRDDEYQAHLYEQGRTRPGSIVTNSSRTTFHGAGLAFDICQNIKGQEYSDLAFFQNCAAIAKHMGFSWGGDWKSFPDRPHFQWDERGKYTFSRAKGPAQMPLYEEEIEMITVESIQQMSDAAVLALANRVQTVLGKQEQQPGKVLDELGVSVKMGITDGSVPKQLVTRAQAAVMAKRAAEYAMNK